MAFTVDDFQDLLRLLEQRPEWRDELRRHVRTEELVQLAAVGRELAGRTDERGTRMGRVVTRMEELADAQLRAEQHLGTLADRVGRIDGRLFELLYADRAPAYFSGIARRLRVIGSSQLADLLDDAVERGDITPEERSTAVLA